MTAKADRPETFDFERVRYYIIRTGTATERVRPGDNHDHE